MKKPICFSILAVVVLYACINLAVLFAPPIYQIGLKKRLSTTFADIKDFLAKPDQTQTEARRLEQEVSDLRECIDKSINSPKFTHTPTWQWKPVKAARCRVIEEIAGQIQPYNPWLLELKFGGKNEINSRVVNGAVALLRFTKPDEILETTLKKKAQEKSDGFWSAIALLYQHDLMDESMRNLLREFVLSQTTPEGKKAAAMYAVYYGYGDAAIPYCEELLQQPFQTNGLIAANGYPVGNQLTMDYQRAFDTLGHIGTNAARLLPLLKKRQEEVVNAKGIEPMKPFILGNLYAATKCLEGTRPVQTESKSPYCTWCK